MAGRSVNEGAGEPRRKRPAVRVGSAAGKAPQMPGAEEGARRMAEAVEKRVAEQGNLRCPKCGSRNVTCEDTRKHHLHECHDCGYRTEAAGRPWV